MDFYFDNDQALDLGSPARKFENNAKAIRLAKEIAVLGRAASADEQAILARYVGWGDSALLRQLNGSQESKDLTEDELCSLRGSSLNAHYTALPVIGAMWDALTFIGLGPQAQPVRIIDPSAGVGHFKSLMPIALRGSADWAEVELDSLTANILKLLHPESKVFTEGYERVDFPQNWFDLAISNVPFGDYGVVKRELPSFLRKSIHDFFFTNTVSLLRPGGVLAFITSRYTLDKKDSSVRTWLARHLDLLAAVRLPNNAFKENAGTDVVTDVLFMRKRFEETKNLPDWVETEFLSQNYRQTNINRHFVQNPQMILGVQGMDGTTYKSDGYTVHADSRILGEAMKEILRSVLPEKLLKASEEVQSDERIESEIAITLSAPNPGDLERVSGLKSIYLAAKKLLEAETKGASLVETSQLRQELNNTYDEFTAKYGPINKAANIRLLAPSGSYEAPFLKALEEYNPTSATAKKADLFSAPMVRSTAQIESPSVDDALLVCLDSKGKVDLSFIARLSNATKEAVTHQLAGRIFRLPSGKGWVMADEYLSGNVREKLREAKAVAVFDATFQDNVAALESAIPLDLKPSQIRAPMGAGWIPTELVEKFTVHLLQEGEYKIVYIPHLAHWEIESTYLWRVPDSIARSRWGTVRLHALELIEAGLNARTVTVYDEVDGVRSANQIETVAAQAKLSEIKAEFERWLFNDSDRASQLCAIYNERFNAYRVRDYDGSHLSAPGLNRKINLRPHQKNAVWRVLQSRLTLLHHEVGMGKTLAALVAVMESKRLRLTRKAMIVVPNHITSQWNMSALAAYPGANILAPTPADLSKSKRGEFLSRVATNDWDIIIVPFSSFKLLPVSAETQSDFYQREIDTLFDYLSELKVDKSPTRAIKEIEKSIKRFQVKLDTLADMRQDDEKTITWEELGVDMLIVDEFHAYKNLYFSTRMTRIAGLTNSDSQRAFDMFVKFGWTQQHGGKVIGLTGTPVTNTLAEFFTMQRYFQLETLQELGLSHFDAWANQFALAEAGLEMTPDGSGFRMNTRFRKFVNVPELMQIWFQVVDAKRVDDNSGIERPNLFAGKPVKVLTDGGQALLDYVSSLAERAEKVRARMVKPDEDNMLCITGDGRKAALDLSLVIPISAGSPMPKIDALADVAADIYETTNTVKGTQIIFCDLATPKAKS